MPGGWIRRYFILFSLIVLGLSALWVAWTAFSAPPTTGGKIPAPAVGFLAPELNLEDGAGNALSVTDFRGRIVVLNFWASWCPPCKAEMPALQALQHQYPDELVVLGIHMTSQDSLAAGKKFIADEGLTFAMGFDLQGSAARQYQIRSLPTTFFIDAQGEIEDITLGGPLSPAQLISRVERLLEEN